MVALRLTNKITNRYKQFGPFAKPSLFWKRLPEIGSFDLRSLELFFELRLRPNIFIADRERKTLGKKSKASHGEGVKDGLLLDLGLLPPW